ncbi:MAG: A/G-specific adenine glycosylase [Rickettsiales bacterium]
MKRSSRLRKTGSHTNIASAGALNNAAVHLSEWYARHGRKDLPWRNTEDAYAIYISEIMLQQTQVKTVLERFYRPFLEQFPTLQALADAPQEKVLKAWEGMGYYSRARNLHAAAKAAAPALPKTVEELMALPGIGRNTAHAVAAFAYHLPVPVMEANVKRVLHRLHASKGLSTDELWQAADSLLDRHDPFTHNQAMMDIGAMICTPKAPKCFICPLATGCKGKAAPETYPLPKQKPAVPTRERIVLVARDAAGKLFLETRGEKLLGGLYGFPQYEIASSLSFQDTSYPLKSLKKLGQITQVYSHFRLKGDIYLLEIPQKKNSPNWYTRDDISALALSRVDHKVLGFLSVK